MTFNCPFPFDQNPHIVLAHGGGGQLMKRLLDELILPILEADKNGRIATQEDAAILSLRNNSNRIAMTTDSFVVNPLFFPGGDIGCLSIYGTVNDLAMMGATAHSISVALILEEGLPLEQLATLLQSMRNAADRAGVAIVTGDTKVVEHGKGDGLYINTTGVGSITAEIDIGSHRISVGDKIILNGDLGRHGIAVMAQREGLQFNTLIESDCAPLNQQVQALLDAGIDIHCMRDITRGGLSSTLNELAAASATSFELNEASIPVLPELHAYCEVLGLDPLFIACEGRFSAIVPADQADAAITVLQGLQAHTSPAIIGEVVNQKPTPVFLKTQYGGQRVLDMLSGEQLPRIC